MSSSWWQCGVLLLTHTGAKSLNNGCSSNEEEVIRCVCNVFRDEGKMIQCENCEVTLLSSRCHLWWTFLIINSDHFSWNLGEGPCVSISVGNNLTAFSRNMYLKEVFTSYKKCSYKVDVFHAQWVSEHWWTVVVGYWMKQMFAIALTLQSFTLSFACSVFLCLSVSGVCK